MKKILYLDFDGVLRPMAYTELCEKLWKENSACKTKDIYGYYFAPYCMDVLKYILIRTGAEIIFSTDWRKNGLEEIKELWLQRGYPFPDRLYGITPLLPSAKRGDEITASINGIGDRGKRLFSYAIIDDIDDMGKQHEGRFVQINKRYGLTMADAPRIIEILNTQYIEPKDPDA